MKGCTEFELLVETVGFLDGWLRIDSYYCYYQGGYVSVLQNSVSHVYPIQIRIRSPTLRKHILAGPLPCTVSPREPLVKRKERKGTSAIQIQTWHSYRLIQGLRELPIQHWGKLVCGPLFRNSLTSGACLTCTSGIQISQLNNPCDLPYSPQLPLEHPM